MAARRVQMDRLQELVRLHRMGVGARAVARQLAMSPNTERSYRRALVEAQLLDGPVKELPALEELKAAVLEQLPRSSLPSQQRSKIDVWRPQVEALLDRKLGAKEIRRRLRRKHDDFDGSYAQVKRLVRTIVRERGVQANDVAIPVQTAPGEVVQVDFGHVGKLLDPSTHTLRKAWAFVAVLGYSRYTWARIVFDQRVETWLQLRVTLVEALGGVPRVFVPDNLKAAVIRAAFTPSDPTAINRSCRDHLGRPRTVSAKHRSQLNPDVTSTRSLSPSRSDQLRPSVDTPCT